MGQPGQDLGLPRSQCRRGVGAGCPVGAPGADGLLHEPAQHVIAERAATGGRLPDCFDAIGRAGVLGQEPARPGGQRRVKVLVIVERGEDDDPDGRVGGQDAGGRGRAVQAGHPQVHQDHIRHFALGEPDGLLAVGRLPDHGDVIGGLAEHPQPGPDELLLLVVDEQYSDHRISSGCGAGVGGGVGTASVAARRHPPSAGPASRCPPTSSTRSRSPTSPKPAPSRARAPP